MPTATNQTEISMKRQRTIVQRARAIARTLGVRPAAGYLRNRGFNLDSALLVLIGRVSK